jgi:predicted O-methyltransferase YrrM
MASRTELLTLAGRKAGPGDWAEFGVANGNSAYVLLGVKPADVTLWLFDSWYGLPEEWHVSKDDVRLKGRYSCNGVIPPSFLEHDSIEVVKGLFEHTVEKWARGRPALGLVHIDCDLYSATHTVLTAIKRLLVPGTLVLFDEYHGYSYAYKHEIKAWLECNIGCSLLGIGKTQALFRVE